MSQEKDKSSTLIIVAIISAVATICAACIAGIFANLDKLPPADAVAEVPFVETSQELTSPANISGSFSTNTPELLPTSTPVPLPTATQRPLPTSTPWTAGIEDPRNPHVIASNEEGLWEPAYGYRWKNPDDEKDFQVVPIIESVTVDHNVSMDGENGMIIHIQFTVDDQYQDVPCHVSAYFYYRNPHKALIAGSDNYTTTDGKVAVGEDFLPSDSLTTYNNLQLFMPYAALNMSDEVKNAELKFYVLLYTKSGEDIAESDWIDFDYYVK